MTRDISSYEKRVYSQNGEDGILEELFSRIGTTNRFFVEFGVQDGLVCLTRNLLVHHGWSGLLMEGNDGYMPYLSANVAEFPHVIAAREFITKENSASLFEKYAVPTEFDLLVIDIDGNDYWVWQELNSYRPRVVVIEYNASYPPPQKMVVPYTADFSWDGTSYFGASLSSLHALGEKLGYSLIGTDTCGVNAFFLRNDLIASSGFCSLPPEKAYHRPNYGPDEGGHPRKLGPFLEI